MASSMNWHGHVEDGHVLSRTLDFEVEGQIEKICEKDMEEAGGVRIHESCLDQEKLATFVKVECQY